MSKTGSIQSNSAAASTFPAFAERFSREGRVLARLNHPNIVTIHDFGQANGFSYLLGAVKHFLTTVQRREHRVKRGEGHPVEPLDPESDTSPGMQVPDSDAPSADREFDRKWAITVLDRALLTLAEEHRAAGKAGQFDTLKPWLTGDTDNLSQPDAARLLGMNESAVKVAIHRLRRRFREAIKAEISRTLSDRALVDEELGHLLSALSR